MQFNTQHTKSNTKEHKEYILCGRARSVQAAFVLAFSFVLFVLNCIWI